jgi:hypothetical protein
VGILLDEVISSDYHYFVVADGVDYDESGSAFSGQTNGLCGGAVPGMLRCMTGRRSGPVSATLVRHDSKPDLPSNAEDVVEVDFVNRHDECLVATWAGEDTFEFLLPSGDWRVRYSAWGMDAGAEDEFSEDVLDHYRLDFWPSEKSKPDTVVRQTSASAAYWNAEQGGKA